jgi:hypothetical protein
MQVLNLIFSSLWVYIGFMFMFLTVSQFVLRYQKKRLQAKVLINKSINDRSVTKNQTSKS